MRIGKAYFVLYVQQDYVNPLVEGPSPCNRRKEKQNIASSNFTVYVPDRSAPFTLPGTLTNEEVRQTIAGMGYSSVENAEMVVSGSTITFRRPTGGTKGL